MNNSLYFVKHIYIHNLQFLIISCVKSNLYYCGENINPFITCRECHVNKFMKQNLEIFLLIFWICLNMTIRFGTTVQNLMFIFKHTETNTKLIS